MARVRVWTGLQGAEGKQPVPSGIVRRGRALPRSAEAQCIRQGLGLGRLGVAGERRATVACLAWQHRVSEIQHFP